jgi:hypothetical protein
MLPLMLHHETCSLGLLAGHDTDIGLTFLVFGLPLLLQYPANALVHRPVLLRHVAEETIKSPPQLDGAFEFLKKLGPETLDGAAFEEAAGVGVVVSDGLGFVDQA